jgi:two-component system, NarL family, response regulator NreC
VSASTSRTCWCSTCTCPGGSVFDLIPKLRADSPATQIVVLTMEADPASARAVRRAGALGYVLKEAAEAELVEAVRLAAQGQPYVNRRIASKLVAEWMREDLD